MFHDYSPVTKTKQNKNQESVSEREKKNKKNYMYRQSSKVNDIYVLIALLLGHIKWLFAIPEDVSLQQ